MSQICEVRSESNLEGNKEEHSFREQNAPRNVLAKSKMHKYCRICLLSLMNTKTCLVSSRRSLSPRILFLVLFFLRVFFFILSLLRFAKNFLLYIVSCFNIDHIVSTSLQSLYIWLLWSYYS